jgi:hypothetical protein
MVQSRENAPRDPSASAPVLLFIASRSTSHSLLQRQRVALMFCPDAAVVQACAAPTFLGFQQ